MSHECWVVCPPGLERVCAIELTDMGAPRPVIGNGGVSVRLSTTQLYGANLGLRTATRVVVRAARFEATTFEQLIAEAEAVEWSRWIAERAPVRLSVASHGSRLFHTDAIAERLAGVLRRPLTEDGQQINVRLSSDRATVSIDSSGAALHDRAWRVGQTHAAPLRATVAAGLLLLAGYDGTVPLVDPFCGSGTIAIEAALLAQRRAPNLGRDFAFQCWPSFKRSALRQARTAAEDAVRPGGAPVVARDRDDGAVVATAANAAAAGVPVDVAGAAVSSLELGDPAGLVATNPPFGVRLGDTDALRDLYDRWGAVMRERGPGWQVAVVDGNPRLTGRLGIGFDGLAQLSLGGLKVRLLVGTVPGTRPAVQPTS